MESLAHSRYSESSHRWQDSVFFLHRADTVAASQGQSGNLGWDAGGTGVSEKLGGGRKDGSETLSRAVHSLSHQCSGILVALC